MLAAKRFPRDEKAALDRILNSCCRESLAAVAQYQFSRGGSDISGPSIRLAEAIAQHWGNIESGWSVVDTIASDDGIKTSVVEAFAWDLESNYRVPRVFNVRHWRDTKQGGYALKDERDIYELCANQAARRVRACLLSVIPGDIVEEAQKQCDTTLAAKADTSPDAQKKILQAFAGYGVNKAQIEAKIQRRIDAITPAQVITLRKIIASLRDGMSEAKDWFEVATETPDALDPTKAKQGRPRKAAPEPAPTPEPEPQPEPEKDSVPLDMLPDAPWGEEQSVGE
jgi:hypothetical protein